MMDLSNFLLLGLVFELIILVCLGGYSIFLYIRLLLVTRERDDLKTRCRVYELEYKDD